MVAQGSGKAALVTGAGSGIGRASALAFGRAGARVVVSDVSVESGEETVRLIRAAGADAGFVRCDVTVPAETEALVAKAVETCGRLDAAHNNAGIAGILGPTAECTEENWDRIMAVNLKGVWLCMRHEIRQMLSQGGGAIVNTSSTAGLVGSKGSAAYAAASHGIIGLTRSAALEYAAANIRVNAVCPGAVETPMLRGIIAGNAAVEAQMVGRVPMGRLGHPQEIAQAVVWLCSDAASFVTGQCLVVDGGQLA